MSINKVILVGNVGKDPVIRYFDRGVAKATFPLATSETYTNQQGETITTTEWHNIVLWRSLAEVAEKTIKKGTQVYIVGKIKTRSYVDKDGNNKYITEILADTFLVLDRKQTSPGSSGSITGQGGKPARESEQGFSEMNEPSSSYNTSENLNNSPGTGNSQPADDDPGSEGSYDKLNGKGEDDLPF
jgi:single-strand DNA-binding protein